MVPKSSDQKPKLLRPYRSPNHLRPHLIANVIDSDRNTHIKPNPSPDDGGPNLITDVIVPDCITHIITNPSPDTCAHFGPDRGAHHTGANLRSLSAQAYAVAFDFVADIATAARIAAGNQPRYAAWPSKSRARS